MATVATTEKLFATERSKTLVSGIVTGQIAGLIMAVVVMIVFTILGKGPLFPVQVIGSALLGESALQGTNISAIIAGLVLHQAGPSLLWGIVFGMLAKKLAIETTAQSLALGLGVGVLSMVGPYLLIPTLMNALHGVDIWNREVPIFWDWAAHIVFGASFALFPTVSKKLG
jgi:hypothetical protein